MGGGRTNGNAGHVRGLLLLHGGKRLKEPWVLGIVRLDGSDGGLVHFVKEAQAVDLRIGMPMEIVFREERTGSILDILHFRPVKE
jgi:uncharacterized OB-fold protein